MSPISHLTMSACSKLRLINIVFFCTGKKLTSRLSINLTNIHHRWHPTYKTNLHLLRFFSHRFTGFCDKTAGDFLVKSTCQLHKNRNEKECTSIACDWSCGSQLTRHQVCMHVPTYLHVKWQKVVKFVFKRPLVLKLMTSFLSLWTHQP